MRLYNEHEVLVSPSLYEGFGLPAAEAMACGTPVVATTAGAFPETIARRDGYSRAAGAMRERSLMPIAALLENPEQRLRWARRECGGCKSSSRGASARKDRQRCTRTC